MTPVEPVPSHRTLVCAVPTRLVRPTFLVAVVLLSLHLLLQPGADADALTQPPAASWGRGKGTGAAHRLVWDPVRLEWSHVKTGALLPHSADGGSAFATGSAGLGSSSHAGNGGAGGSFPSPGSTHGVDTPPADDVLLYASSAAHSLALLRFAAAPPSSSAGRTLLFSPPTPFSPSVQDPALALALLQKSLAKLDEDQARDEGRWRADGWERYQELTRLAMAKALGGEHKVGEDVHDEGPEDRLRLKGVVLGSCADDLPLLTPVLHPLHAHAPFSLACIVPSPSSSSSSSAPAALDLPWADLLPFAGAGFLTLLTSPHGSGVRALQAALDERARDEQARADGWEWVAVRALPPAAGGAELGQLPALTAAVRAREAAAANARSIGGKRKDLRSAVVVLHGEDGGSDVGQLLADFVKELAADPKSWGYTLPPPAPKKPSSLAAALLKGGGGGKTTAQKGGGFAPVEGADDRFELVLAYAPEWLRAPAAAADARAGKGAKGVRVPRELEQTVRVVGSWQGGQQEDEQAFWTAVVDAQVVVDLGAGEEALLQLVSRQAQTPLLTPRPPSLLPPSSSSSAPLRNAHPNALPLPRALTPAAALRVLRRGNADGVELGAHWKLREEVVGLLRRGVGWVAEDAGSTGKGKGGGKKQGAEGGVSWEDVFVRPY